MVTRRPARRSRCQGTAIKDVKGAQDITEEAEHKSCYDTELITTKHIRYLKVKESDELTAESEKFTAEVRQLVAEIAALGDETAALAAALF